MASAAEDIGLIQSDYVINQINDSADQRNENETALGERPTAIRSQYMDEKMRSFLTVSANRNYQDHPSAIRRVPLMGKPISSNELRSRVNTLDTTVYSPMIIDGKLYFVDQNDDVRTARSSNSMESTKTAQSIPYINDDDITFTLSELKTLLPRSAISDLMKYYEEHMKVKRISSEDQAIIKLENALHVEVIRSYYSVTTARPHSLVTAALPSDSTHTATSSTELFNFNTARSPNETTAVPINLEEEKKDAITGQD
nr:Protein F32H2.7 [Haemonchus contortus]